MKTGHKLALLSCLYISQGLPFGFFTQALPVFMRDQGVSLTGIGLSYLLALPWGLKFLWAPYIDRWRGGALGPRRSWILPLQWGAAALMLLISVLEPTALSLVLTGVLLANLLAATQDVATDALALELLTVEERGLGNGVQVAGYRVGMIIGGGILLVAYADLGWTWIFVTMAGLLLLATLPVALYREPRHARIYAQRPDKGWRVTLKGYLAQRGAWGWLGVLVLYKSADAMASAMARPMLRDLGLHLDDLGWLFGFGGFTAGFVGALAGGYGVQRLGRHKALLIFGAVQSVAVLGYVLPAAGHIEISTLYGVILLDTFAGGLATAALFTMMMDACRLEHAASDYTLQASVVVLSTGATSALSGALADAWGYVPFFIFAGLATAAGLWVCAITLRRGRFVFPSRMTEPDEVTVEVFS